MAYKKCFVPTCPNDTKNSPNKLFPPLREELKKKWCNQVKAELYTHYPMYCCEDHLDSRNDLKNYYRAKFMHDTPVLKPDAILRYRVVENDECIKCLPSISNVQVNLDTELGVKIIVKGTKKRKSIVQEYPAAADIESTDEDSCDTVSPSVYGSTSEYTTDEITINKKKNLTVRSQTLSLIEKHPKMYLGLPAQYYWLVNYLVANSEIKTSDLCIMLALMKIKLNDTVIRLGHQFELSKTEVSRNILNGITVMANFFQNIIFLPSPIQIKKKLPLVYKIRYSNVQMILDCFEIQIEKPSDPMKQSQTWSQYKNCNTIKYLIGCTPNGFVSFISKGFGGRMSDKTIVDKSGLVDILPSNAVILADRGFKEIESLLALKQIKLLRPPSVYPRLNIKPTKDEVLQSKVIASLRVHIERVIGRIREFRLLKPHSVVNYKYVGCLDHMVIIACGLINLQNEIIKNN